MYGQDGPCLRRASPPICPLASRHSLGIGRRSFFLVASTYVSPQESLILAYVVFFFLDILYVWYVHTDYWQLCLMQFIVQRPTKIFFFTVTRDILSVRGKKKCQLSSFYTAICANDG